MILGLRRNDLDPYPDNPRPEPPRGRLAPDAEDCSGTVTYEELQQVLQLGCRA